MTMRPELERQAERNDFTDFVAAEHGVSRDAAQAVLGEWLLHYLPSARALRKAREQEQAQQRESATDTSAA